MIVAVTESCELRERRRRFLMTGPTSVPTFQSVSPTAPTEVTWLMGSVCNTSCKEKTEGVDRRQVSPGFAHPLPQPSSLPLENPRMRTSKEVSAFKLQALSVIVVASSLKSRLFIPND